MFSKLKRFSSGFVCLIFYIFLFTNNFGLSSFCNATDDNISSVKPTKYVPIDISASYNSNKIWGTNESWDSATINFSWGHYYTKDPERNNNANGLPSDGKVSIGGIPFEFNASSGKDCVNISTMGTINFSQPIRVKNLYVIGALNGFNPLTHTNPDNFKVEFYKEEDDDEVLIEDYTQNLGAYDWCYSSSELKRIVENGESSLIGYKGYNVRLVESGKYYASNPAMQCWRLNKFSDNNTSFEDNQISRIEFSKINDTSSNLMIFAITAEVDSDNNENITLSDIKYNQFKVICGNGISGKKDVKISITPGANNENMLDNVMFPYIYSAPNEGTIYYCTVYDDIKKAYYYFAVKTKKTLKLVLQDLSDLVYNGTSQQLITKVLTLDVNGNPRPEDETNLLKANIYLRIKNAENTSTHDTGWNNLNGLINLVATNVGTYNIYYYIDEDNLDNYELVEVTVTD